MKKLACLALSLIVMGLSGCGGGGPDLDLPLLGGRMSDAEQIGRVLDRVHRGMQAKKVYQVMEHVSADYLDQEGRDYEGIRQYLNGIMKDYREIVIRRTPPTVVIEGDRARAVEAFGTRAEPSSDGTPPLNIQGQVSVYLQREAEGWKIVEWGAIS